MNKNDFLAIKFRNEDHFSASVNLYINNNYKELRKMYFHIANESATSDKMRIKLVSMGVLAGVPDFCILLPHVWFMELKMEKGILSPKQKEIHTIWKAKGIDVVTCFNAKNVIDAIDNRIY
jgi:hypothetical protein